MSIWQTIMVKITSAIATLLVAIGVSQPSTVQSPIVEIQPIIQAPTVETTTEVVINKKVVIDLKAVENSNTTTQVGRLTIESDASTTVEIVSTTEIFDQPIIQPVPEITTGAEAPITNQEIMPPVNPPVELPVSNGYTIEVINPMSNKGLGRDGQYLSRSEILDEANYIDIGLVVYNETGESVNDSSVIINATDESQNKILTSTGNIRKLYKDGIQVVVYYYPFHYEFKSPGRHTITFVAEGKTTQVAVEVAEDTRP